jgi:Subtilase family
MSDVERPLLVGGEALSQQVERAPRGGPKFDPVTIEEARRTLWPQVESVASRATQIPIARRGDRIAFQLTLLPNYLAASYHPARTLEVAHLEFIGTRSAEARYRTPTIDEARRTRSLIVAGTPPDIERLSSIVHGSGRSLRGIEDELRRISDIRFAERHEVLRVPEGRDAGVAIDRYEAVLHPNLDLPNPTVRVGTERRTVLDKWVAFVAALGGIVITRYAREVDGLIFVPIEMDPTRLEEVIEFNPLRAIRPLPQMRPLPTSLLRAAPPPLPTPPTDTRPQADGRIAVFDAGMDSTSPYVAAMASLTDLTSEPPGPHAWHGHAVTLATLHGLLEPGATLPRPPMAVDHYRVLPVPPAEDDFDANWILDRIIETVEQHDYPIVNLSLGPAIELDEDDEPHRWTSELDRLARERDSLFVVAVGNNGERDHASGQDRVQVPGDAVCAMSVGAADHHDPTVTWSRAPYSAVGPGRGGATVKPTAVAFGGVPSRWFTTISSAGTWYDTKGTSFATPLVSHAMAELFADGVVGGLAVNTLRALAVHFSEPGTNPAAEVGHGLIPASLRPYLRLDHNDATVVYEGSLPRGPVVGLSLPVPDMLVSGLVDIRWTLAITPQVAPADPTDYTRQGVEVQFRPSDQIYDLVLPDGRRVSYNRTAPSAAADAALAAGALESVHPKARPFGNRRLAVSEADLVENGKWETLIHVRDRMRASGLSRPRLDIAYLAREGALVRGSAVPDLDYTLVVSVVARRDIDIYSAVRAQFPVLVPVTVRTRSAARVRV